MPKKQASKKAAKKVVQRPVSKLVTLAGPSAIWRGNLLEDGDMVSDGKLMFSISCVVVPQLGLASQLMDDHAGRAAELIPQDKAWSIGCHTETKNDIVGTVLGSSKGPILVEIRQNGKRKVVKFDPNYWCLAKLLTEFDRIVLKDTNSPAALFRGDDLAGLLTPVKQ